MKCDREYIRNRTDIWPRVGNHVEPGEGNQKQCVHPHSRLRFTLKAGSKDRAVSYVFAIASPSSRLASLDLYALWTLSRSQTRSSQRCRITGEYFARAPRPGLGACCTRPSQRLPPPC